VRTLPILSSARELAYALALAHFLLALELCLLKQGITRDPGRIRRIAKMLANQLILNIMTAAAIEKANS